MISSHFPMGVMRVFQLPLVAKYCCVAKAQPLTPGSTDTEEKSPNLHWSGWLLHWFRLLTPPVASTVPGRRSGREADWHPPRRIRLRSPSRQRC